MTDQANQDPFAAFEQPKSMKLETISEASRMMTREFMKETIRDFEEIAPLSLIHDRASLVHTMVLLRIRLFCDLARANRPDIFGGLSEENHESPSIDSGIDPSTDGIQEPGNKRFISSRQFASAPEATNSASRG